MAALSPPRFFAAWRVEALFSAVSLFPMGSTICAFFDSLPDQTRRKNLDPGRFSHMNVIIPVIPRCASSLPLCGSSRANPSWCRKLGNPRISISLLQDVTDQVYYMLASGAHVP